MLVNDTHLIPGAVHKPQKEQLIRFALAFLMVAEPIPVYVRVRIFRNVSNRFILIIVAVVPSFIKCYTKKFSIVNITFLRADVKKTNSRFERIWLKVTRWCPSLFFSRCNLPGQFVFTMLRVFCWASGWMWFFVIHTSQRYDRHFSIRVPESN